jgi:WD40 repeat protein/F0F1-type ATP synthase membrane subunit b/b'
MAIRTPADPDAQDAVAAPPSTVVGVPPAPDASSPNAAPGGAASPAGEPPPLLGPRIDGYRVTARLGAGGAGVVWRAVQLSTNRDVALKVLGHADDPASQSLARFQREVDLMGRLEHPNLARVYDGGRTADGTYYCAMELVDGVHLDRFVRDRRLARRPTLELMRGVCEAVQYAHQKGVIHRDLKPNNVLVDADGRPRVLDFGLAKLLVDGAAGDPAGGMAAAVTVDGVISGTPAYMSPEQAAGRNRLVDTRSDVYSLGVTLFHLLTGQFPHDTSGSQWDVLRRIVRDDPRRLSAVDPRVDRDLDAVLAKATAREPERRYGTAGGLAADLARYLAGEPVEARPPSLRYLLRKKLRRHRAATALAATAAAAVLATLVWAYARVARARNSADAQREVVEEQAAEAKAQRAEAVAARREADAMREAADRQRDLAVAAQQAEARQLAAAAAARAAEQQQREEADRQRDAAQAGERRSRDSERSARRQMADLFTREGLGCLDGNDPGLAALWFVESLFVERLNLENLGVDAKPNDAGREAATRTRIATALALARRPAAPRVAAAAGRDGNPAKLGKPFGQSVRQVGPDSSLGPVLGHGGLVVAAAFSADGRRVVTGSWDKTARVWDAVTGHALTAPMLHPDVVTVAAFGPDGTRVLTAAGDGGVRIWDAGTGEPVGRPLAHPARVSAAAFDPAGLGAGGGGRVVTACDDGSVRVWDVATGRAVVGPPHVGAARHAAFGGDGRWVVTAGDDAVARVWNAATGRPLGPPLPHDPAVMPPAVSVDGRQVLTVSGSAARVWDVAAAAWASPPLAHAEPVLTAAFDPDAARVVTGGADRQAVVWDVATGRPAAPPLPHAGPVRQVAFGPDGTRVATCGDDRTARVWDAATGQPLTPALRHADVVRHVHFSPDGGRLATGGDDKAARVWDLATGRPVAPGLWHDSRVQAVAFAPDCGRLVTLSLDRSAKVLDLTPDPRPAEVLRAAAELAANRRLDETRSAVQLTAEEVRVRSAGGTPPVPPAGGR